MAAQEQGGRDTTAIEELLRELKELRELDQRRHGHPRGSAEQRAADLEVDRRSRHLMDAFREFRRRPD